MSIPVIPITEREFDLYALSLPRGPNFDPLVLHSAWKSRDRRSVGAVLFDPQKQDFGIVTLRRQIDHRFVVTHQHQGLRTPYDAKRDLVAAMRPGEPAEPLPSGEKRRPQLLKVGRKEIDDRFKLLTSTLTHVPALMTIGETYLAMPRPDDNFVSDFQTSNFDSRLWELYLLAVFREQGVLVTQDHPSPDFLIERAGHECYVEAVTANPRDGPIQGFPSPSLAPQDREERLLGAPAVRFAKTLRSKLQREYDKAPHVHGKAFAIAIADFHAPSSMVWSREALPSYLYGVNAQVKEGPNGPIAVGTAVDVLRGDDRIPAGLFRDPTMSHLSAVIFSNAATLGKFNRMGYLAGWRPPGLTMVREGLLFDRTPGALEPISFKLDVLSDEYEAMWPWGEAWCQELEAYHNPLATHPIAFDLLPGATHWFESDGEIICSSMWKWSVLSSVTHLQFKDRSGR